MLSSIKRIVVELVRNYVSCVLLSLIFIYLLINMSESTIIVETTKGPVRGIRKNSILGTDFYRFRGIPYAQAPIGDLRFKDPQPVEAWTVPVDATKQGPTAVALNFLTFGLNEGYSEDCLTLNIYTKEIHPRKPLPVMVWIHGGAFKYGDSTENMYGPDYLLEMNVIFVSINYRLGAFGFLSIPDPVVKVAGNAGLKDQTMALRWVRENIHVFGGDRSNITLFGESAGAASVHWHMLSDFSKGLFDKAIIQSGSALADWSNIPQLNWAERLAKHLGWNGEDGSVGCYEFLKNVDALEIVKEQEKIMTDEEKKIWIFSPYAPTIEPYVAEQSFFTTDPLNLYKTAWGNEIPLVIGANSEEGILWYHDLTGNPSRYDQVDSFENLFSFKFGAESYKTKLYAEKTKQFYYGEEQPNAQNISKFMDILADKNFLHGINLAIQGRVDDSKSAPTYLYRFNFDSKSDFILMKKAFATADTRGVCHAEELEYLFKTSFAKPVIENSSEHKTMQRLISSWTQFAATGNPNAEVLTVYWKPVIRSDNQPFYCLNISENVTFVSYPEAERMELWNSFV